MIFTFLKPVYRLHKAMWLCGLALLWAGGLWASCGSSISFSVPNSVCLGGKASISFSATGGAADSLYRVVFGDGDDSLVTSAGSMDHTYGSTGKFYLKLIRTGKGNCKDTITDSITVLAKPATGFTLKQDSVCSGEVDSFFATTAGLSNYLWRYGSGATSSGQNTPQSFTNGGASPASTTVRLITTGSNGCKDSSALKTVVVMPLPNAGFSFTPDSACSGTAVSFTNSSTGASSYKWKEASTVFSTATNSSRSFVATGNGFSTVSISVVAISSFGCRDSASKNVRVKQRPDGSVADYNNSPAYTYCNAGNFAITLDDSSTTTGTDSTHFFDWGDGNHDTVQNFSGSNISHTYGSKGFFSLKITTLGKNKCPNTRTYTIFNGGNPSVGLGTPGGTTGLCAPALLRFPVSGTSSNPPGTLYTISSNDGSSSITYTHPNQPDTIDWTFYTSSCGASTQTGCPNAYQIKITAENPCGFSQSLVEPITLTKKPTADFSISPNDTVCQNTNVTFTDASYGAKVVTGNSCVGGSAFTCGTNYKRLWIINPNAGWDTVSGSRGNASTWTNSNPATSGSANFTGYFKDTGVYTIQLAVTNSPSTCGNDTATKKIVVIPPPIAAFHVNPDSGCVNLTDTFVNTSKGIGNTYKWTITPGTGTSYQNSTSDTSFKPIVQFTSAGLFVVKLEVTNPCTTIVAFDTVKVKSKPTVSLAAIGNGCRPFTVSPNASYNTNQGTISSYMWSFPTGSPASSSSQNPGSVNYTSSGSKTITIKATNECGSDSASRSFTVFNLPTVGAGKTVDTLCANHGSFTLSGYSPAGGSWSGTAVTSGGVFNTVSSGVGNFTLKYTYTDGNGCTDTASKVVKVLDKPTVKFNLTNRCIDTAIAFTDSSTAPSSSIASRLWRFGDGSTSTATNPTHSYATAGNYTVTLIISNAIGCTDSLQKTVTVYPKPVADFSVNNNPQCKVGNNFVFTNGTSISSGTVSYNWNFGDTASAFYTTTNPSHSYADTGSYPVKLRVVSDRGCRDSITKTMQVLLGPSVNFTINDTVQCLSGNSFTFTDPAGNTSGVFWDFGNGNTSSTGGVKTQNYTSPGSYQVKLRVSTGASCKDSLVKTIVVKASPVPSFYFSANSFCAAQSDTISNTSSATPAVSAWKWIIVGTTSITVSNDTAKQPTFHFADNQSGTDSGYTVRLLATTADGCVDSVSENITIRSRPLAMFSLPADSCGSYTFTPKDSSSFASGYNWTVTPASGITITNGTTASPTIGLPENFTGATITYTVKLVANTSNGCLDSSTRSIKVFRRPLASFAMSRTDTCSPVSINLTNASTPAAGMLYNWDFGNGGSGTPKDTAILYQNPGVNDSVYSIKLTVKSAQGCFDDTTRILTVRPDAKAVFSATNTSGCAPFLIDSSVISTAIFANANSSYQWYVNGTNIGTGSGFPGYTITNANDSVVVKLKAISKNGCKNDSLEVQFKTIDNPKPGFTVSDSVGCSPLQVLFVNTATPSGLSFTWEFGGGVSPVFDSLISYWKLDEATGNATDTKGNNTLVNTNTVSYSTGQINNGANFTKSSSQKLSISDASQTGLDITGDMTLAGWVKLNSNVNGSAGMFASKAFYSGAGTDDKSFQFYLDGTPQLVFGASSDGINVTNTAVSWNPTLSTWYHVAVVYKASAGTVDYYVNGTHHGSQQSGYPNSIHNSAASFNLGSSEQTNTNNFLDGSLDEWGVWGRSLSATDISNLYNGGVGISYLSSNPQSTSNQSDSVYFTFTNSGTADTFWTVKQVAKAGIGCKDSITKQIKIYGKPAPAFSLGGSSFCSPKNITVSNSTGTAPIHAAWLWRMDGSTGVSISNDTAKQPIFSFPDNKTGADSSYTIWLKQTSADGCADSVSEGVTLYTRPVSKFGIPTDSCGPIGFAVADSANFASSYLWSISPTAGTTLSSSTASAPSFGLPENYSGSTITYTLKQVVSTANSCKDSSTKTIKVYTRPTARFTMSRTDSCGPLTVFLTNTSTPATGMQYNWNFGNGSGGTAKDTFVTYTTGGQNDSIYSIYLKVKSSFGCEDDTARTLTLRPDAKALFTATDSVGCAPYSIPASKISATHFANANSQYKWFVNSTQLGSNQTGATLAFPGTSITNANDSIVISLVAISKNGCVNDTLRMKFKTIPNPQPNFVRSDTVGCHAFAVSFSDSSTPAGGLGYFWNFGNGQTSTQQNPNCTFTNTGNTDSVYTVKLVVSAGTGCSDSISKKIYVKPLPNPAFSLNKDSLCFPATATVSNTSTQTPGIVAYHWKISGSGTSIANDTASGSTAISFPDNQSGSYQNYTSWLIVTSNFGCVDSISKPIVVPTRPVAAFASNPDSSCGPKVFSITNNSQYGSTWKWTTANGNISMSSSTAFEPTLAVPENLGLADSLYGAKLVATTIHGCKDSTVDTIMVHPRPQAGFTADSTYSCGPVLVSFTNTGSGNTSLSHAWDFGDGGSSNDSNPTHTFVSSALQDSTYTVTLISTTIYGCKDTVQSIIKTKPSPTAKLGLSDTLICTYSGSPATISIFNFSKGNVDTFYWDFGDGNLNNTTSNATQTHSYPNEGHYTVKLKTVNECNTSRDSMVVTVLEVPHVSFTLSDTQTCDSFITITNTTSNSLQSGYISFLWNFGDSSFSSTVNPGVKTYLKNKTGKDSVYKISLTAFSMCDTITVTDSVKFRTIPYANFAPAKQFGCSPLALKINNQSLGVDSNSNPAINYYVWEWGDSTQRDTTYNRSTFTHTYFTGITDTFTIRMWAYNDCGVDSEQHDVIVYPNSIAPFVSISPANGMGCNPLTVSFTNTTTGANTFLWNFDSTNTANSRDAVWTFTKADSFSVAMTSSNGCSDTTIFIPIIVTDPPVAAFTDNGSHCQPADIYFTNLTTNATSYSWNFGDGDTSVAQSPVHSFDSAGTFKVSLLARNVNQYALTCLDTVSTFITINPKPIAVLVVDTPKGCEPFVPKFTASGSSFANNYSWNFGNGNSSNSLSPAPTFTTAGRDTFYTVSLTVSNSFGCTDSTGTQVTVYAKPTANFSRSDSFACYPGNITLTNTSSFNAFTALWQLGDGDTSTSFNSVNHTYLKAGSYTPKLSITTIWGCKDSVSKNIKIGGNDTLKIKTNDTVVCVGVNVKLTCSVSNPQSITWNFGDGNTSTTGSGVSVANHSYADSGIYTVTMTMTGPDGCVDSAAINIKVNPLPYVDFSVNTVGQCVNAQNYQFSNQTQAAAGISGYLWKFGDGKTSTQTISANTYAASGTYVVKLIATTNLGCVDSTNYTVTVFPKPTPGFSINDSEQCINGNSFTFTSTSTISSGSLSYVIDFGDGNTQSFSSSTITHGYADTGTYTVKLWVNSNLGCQDSISKKVYVRVKPDVSFYPDNNALCLNGNSFQMVNTSSVSVGSIGYQWAFGDGGTATSISPSHTYTTNGTYAIKLKGISDRGCTDSAYQTVVVWPKPNATLGINDSDQCVNAQNFIFTNNSNIAYGSMTHEIDFGDGNRQAFTTASIGHSYATPGFYTVKLISTSDSSCMDSISRKVYVAPKPSVDFAITTDTGQCLNGNLFRFKNNSSIAAGSQNFTWHYGDGTSYNTTQANPDALRSYTSEGLYWVKLVAKSDYGCVDSAEHSVTVYPKPAPDFSIANADQCLTGNSFSFTNSSSIASGSMSFWIDFDDSTIQQFNNSTIAYSFLHPDTFSVKVLAVSDLGCRDSIYKPVVVRPMPNMAFSVDDSGQCENANLFSFTNQSNIGYGILNYTWNFGNGDTSNLPNPQKTYTTLGSYAVTLLARSNFGCPGSVAHNVFVHPKPQAAFTVSDSDNCVLLDAQFTNQSSSDVVGWTWDFGDLTSGSNVSNQPSPSHTYLQTGSFVPSLITENNFGCWDTVYGKMKVFADPVSLFTYTPKNACDTPVVVSFTNQSSGGVSYVWNFGNTKTSTQPHPFAIYTASGYYPVTLTTYSTEGCADSLTIVYIVAPEPIAEFDADPDSGCEDLKVHFTNTSRFTLLHFWDFGDGQGSTDTNPVHVYENPGQYIPVLAVQNGNCRDTLVGDTITVWPGPVADFGYAHLPGGGGEVKFSNLSQGSTSWLWNFDDGTTATLFNTQHRFGLHGSYLVQLVAFTDRLCTDTFERPLSIDLMKGLYVPNAFTPEANSGDAMLFKPQGIGLETYSVRVFTTWGELVWESTELEATRPKAGWNGTRNGLPCKADVYVWKIEAKFLDGIIWPGKTYEDGSIKPMGTVTLIR